VKFFGEKTPDGAFTSSHRANQNQIGHDIDQRPTAMA
jgi:hypothetical protein